MKTATVAIIVACAILITSLPIAGSVHTVAASAYISVSPTKAPVGDSIIVAGQGFPPNTNLILNWSTANVTWAVGLNPAEGDTTVPQVNGVNTVPFQLALGSVTTNATGSFSQAVTVPVDNNGQHIITAFAASPGGAKAQATFVLEPKFTFYPTSGPPGTPITVIATGLGARLYASAYHVLWDNNYIGYMTGVTTHGQANFTFYATGDPGVHAVTIYNGYPGPAFLNSNQAPMNVQITSYDPPLIPFHGQFTITSPTQASQGTSPLSILSILGLGMIATAMASTGVLAVKPGFRKGIGKMLAIMIMLALLVVGGTAMFFMYSSGNPGTSAGHTKNTYTPETVVIRPNFTIPQTAATSGPRISVSPNVATVGTLVNVTGLGFPSGITVPLNWTTYVGSHVAGFGSSNKNFMNVTTSDSGSFSFTMKVPSDLGGIHYITASNLAQNGNASLYIERTASISATQGPQGSRVVITILGTGWDYQSNIVAVDYDNSYIGYGCGFNAQGNITIFLTVMGAPGYHTIDLYPSVYLGPPAGSTIAIFRYPVLTPYDMPELVPAFHFSFLVTQAANESQGNSGTANVVSGGLLN